MTALPPIIRPPIALLPPPGQIGQAPQESARGILSSVGTQHVTLFVRKTRRVLQLTVPHGFTGVDSNDGIVRHATTARIRLGMFADVTYRTAEGRHVVTHVELLTKGACSRLTASELASGAPRPCPD